MVPGGGTRRGEAWEALVSSILVEPPASCTHDFQTRPRPDEALHSVEGLDDDPHGGRGCGHLDDRTLVQVLVVRFGYGHGET